MKKRTLLTAMLVLTMAAVQAQTTEVLDNEYGARLSLQADKKLAKGLHIFAEEEIRLDDNFSSFNRLHTTVGITYKALPWLKVGMGYALINPYSSANKAFKSARHRLMLDATAQYQWGHWQFGLKERLQATYRSGDMNTYQAPRTAMALKSRISVKYQGWRRIVPFAAFELRNTLNAPVVDAFYDGSLYTTVDGYEIAEAGWFISGWNGTYVNRRRVALGTTYKITRGNSLRFQLLADCISDKEIDANAAGTKLKSYTLRKGFVGWACVDYTFSF
ncbi:MAG: DUF2490 domain-containing protein [Bacteroidales bacterium]|nr:DUF2490 domain-containing protein [Bacteroidales bacterium]